MRCSMARQATAGEVQDDKQQDQADSVDANHVHPARCAGDGPWSGRTKPADQKVICAVSTNLCRRGVMVMRMPINAYAAVG